MSKKITLLLLFFGLLAKGYGQHLFEEKFKGCAIDQFTLEKDSATVHLPDRELLTIFLSGVAPKERQKIRGILTVQILVDGQGNSCLVSLRNETNLKTRKWHLPQAVAAGLKWPIPPKKVALVLAVKFTEKGAQFRRFGVDNSLDWKVIKT
ncbi:hypothetical protein TH63_13535 [Rufibacter radiotolerans]|uniref:TonB-like protein n=1 Tax=Rufibacter radiotolerans TaxID=1379910 RepID=A0A0H4VRK6_9BACT|nr:hypothetical protein [Rufibacter radiotolerans]AKQ46414.1 hypothetical protein TH63_13535 [Rufibacter radiotolerans]